ncbi:MAG: hypothetical protein ACR2MS_01195 [Weeksellaceae bacterium]
MKVNLTYGFILIFCILCSEMNGQEESKLKSPNLKIEAEVVQDKQIHAISENSDQIASQNTIHSGVSQEESEVFKPKGKFGFFLIGGYAFGLDENTNGGGNYIPADSDESSNDFYIKYARVNGSYQITPKIKGNLLLNLADFKSADVSRKVLEIASVTYAHNKALNLRVGQYRPYFGVENTYGIGNHLSNAWSNTYSLMGKSNWQSFQIGASLYGDLSEENIPVKYYLNVYNGNGKNRIADNDSNKNISSRLVLTAIPGVEVAANYAIAKHLDENVNAAAFDFKTHHDFSSAWAFNSEFSYAFGHNLGEAIGMKVPRNELDNYKFRSWYFTPELVYALNSSNLKSVRFSCRYESMYNNLDNKNLRTIITPMLSFDIADNFRSSVVAIIDKYDKENATQGLMDTQWMQLQLQFNY